MIIRDRATEETVVRGDCDERVSPASTFKLVLAVIGFDRGILEGPHRPVWLWTEDYIAPTRDRRAVDPASWLKDSVLWYSRMLTSKIGVADFSRYVELIGYGNGDLSGDPGKQNGLSNAWVSSSLRISPFEQVDFIESLLSNDLPASSAAQNYARDVLPTFKAGEWHLHGKTGSGWITDSGGELDKTRPFGWFVGWGEMNGTEKIFVRLRVDDQQSSRALGLDVRDEVIAEFKTDLSALR